jgi:hypothetical protein
MSFERHLYQPGHNDKTEANQNNSNELRHYRSLPFALLSDHHSRRSRDHLLLRAPQMQTMRMNVYVIRWRDKEMHRCFVILEE